jgi:hypothetical protein
VKLLICAAIALSLILAAAGCAKKSGDAIIISKEHIEKRADSTPTESALPAAAEGLRPMADDEIAVDGYVMKRDARGTSRDPRAINTEQWNVKVRMEGGREFNVPTERVRWEKLKAGDRVRVKYSQGNYTGTVWGAEIEDGG